jgi:hypothetical protein
VLGEQRVLVVLVTWGPEPYSESTARGALDEAAAYMRSASFGRMWIVGEVTPWLRALTAQPACSLQQISDVVLNAARAQGYDTARYTTLGIAVPQIDCPAATSLRGCTSRERGASASRRTRSTGP